MNNLSQQRHTISYRTTPPQFEQFQRGVDAVLHQWTALLLISTHYSSNVFDSVRSEVLQWFQTEGEVFPDELEEFFNSVFEQNNHAVEDGSPAEVAQALYYMYVRCAQDVFEDVELYTQGLETYRRTNPLGQSHIQCEVSKNDIDEDDEEEEPDGDGIDRQEEGRLRHTEHTGGPTSSMEMMTPHQQHPQQMFNPGMMVGTGGGAHQQQQQQDYQAHQQQQQQQDYFLVQQQGQGVVPPMFGEAPTSLLSSMGGVLQSEMVGNNVVVVGSQQQQMSCDIPPQQQTQGMKRKPKKDADGWTTVQKGGRRR